MPVETKIPSGKVFKRLGHIMVEGEKMARRNIFAVFLFLFLVSFCSAVLAQQLDDGSSGNIRVDLTRLDQDGPYMFILGGVLCSLLVLMFVLVFVLRARLSSGKNSAVRPSASCPKSAHDESVSGVVMKPVREQSFRGDGYYGRIFDEMRVSRRIVDEKVCLSEVGEVSGDHSVDRYLKEDERIIINVLRMKHNSCSQATLRVVTDFSKARLSRILSELEQRGIIFKDASGRKNIITLRA